jgi:HlyD family secretion protein
VQHKDSGIVAELRVRNGDPVEACQHPMILDNTKTKAKLTSIGGLLDEAPAMPARFEAQRHKATEITRPPEFAARAGTGSGCHHGGADKAVYIQTQRHQCKKEQFSPKSDQLTEQVSDLAPQKVSNDKQIALVKGELGDLKERQQQGLVPVSRVMAMDRETANLDGQRGELVANKASVEAHISEVKLQILQVDEEDRWQTVTELRKIEGKVTEYKERKLAAASRLGRMVVKAPITGSI